MLFEEVFEIINLVLNDSIVRNVAISITVLCTILPLFVSPIAAIFIFISYILGFIVSWLLIKYQSKTNIYIQQLTSFYRDCLLTRKKVSSSCSICDDLSCKRHEKSQSIAPWKHLYITSKLNFAVEHFYERIIENFISSWYRQFTNDDDFSNELKYCLRYSSAAFINRLLELDIGEILSKKILPCAVKHIDDYLYIQQIGKLKNAKFNDVIVEYLGKRLHAATTNRKNELAYLQNLVSSLMVHILPDDYLKCKNYSVVIREILSGWVILPLMDALADPNIINYLVILSVTYKPKKVAKSNGDDQTVEFLYNFECKYKTKISSFATNLNKIKNDTSLLYAFMQFLKKQDNVNLLQFCLDVDDFNVKLLTPDLSKKQVEELHMDAVKLYKDYLDKGSFNCISCPSNILQDFDYLVQEYYSFEKLTKLSKLLYKAYDYIVVLLETVWLPKFFHSTEFYSHICGTKLLSNYSKHLASKQKKYDSPNQGAVSKLSSGFGRIKGVLKVNQPVDGAFYPNESQGVDTGMVGDILLGECNPLIRDLSTWRVWISTFQTTANKIVHFYLNVETMDVVSDDGRRIWSVWRKDQDFYTLKAKLVEFHGESEICDSPLPSRKAGTFVEARMSKYEEFIKKLLLKPSLRGSDLLFAFLTVEEDFTLYITTNALNLQDFGNIYQSMAYKLRKEKGQHLDAFMESFLKSTGTVKNEKPDWAEISEALDPLSIKYSDKITFPKTYRNYIFNDNFGIQHSCLKETMSGSFNPESFTQCFFYLLRHIFKVSNGILKLYASVCSIAEHLVETIFKMVVEHKIKSALSQSNLAYLVKQLEELIFTGHVSPTKDELEKRRKRAFQLLDESFPSLLSKLFGTNVKIGVKTILEILQNPHYNKQLVYNLMDIIVTQMYPILNTKEEHYKV